MAAAISPLRPPPTMYEEALAAMQEELGCTSVQELELAEALDSRDLLQHCKDLFAIPKQGQTLYLCTNSLGLQPRDTSQAIEAVMTKWREEAVTSWFHGEVPFAYADERVLPALATLVGAEVHEVVAMNTLSVNIHLMLASFYQSKPSRRKIIVEEGAFPSDLHVLRSHLAHVNSQHGSPQKQDDDDDDDDDEDLILVIPRRKGEATWRQEDILNFIATHGQEVNLCFLSGVHYASGQCFAMAAITQAAHAQGIVVGWDLAHAVGNVELHLHEWGVDFACWCHYKYLCAGPGTVGGAFVHEKHTEGRAAASIPPLPRLTGWWGQVREDRFGFAEPNWRPALGALSFQLSTPSPLLLACLQASLSVFERCGGMQAIRAKSVLLTGYLQLLLEELLPDQVQILTPRATEERGCQLSLTFSAPDCNDATIVLRGLQARNVMADVRSPNIIRVAPFPLYTRFADVRSFVLILQDVLQALADRHKPPKQV